MNTLVDDLYPLGAPNEPIGGIWRWQPLVGGGPLTTTVGAGTVFTQIGIAWSKLRVAE